MLHALERKEIQKGDVIVIRYEGPKGGPGMPEMLTPTSAVMARARERRRLDYRRPVFRWIAWVHRGAYYAGSAGRRPDRAGTQRRSVGSIDAKMNLLQVDISDDELASRKRQWQMPAYKATRGTLAEVHPSG